MLRQKNRDTGFIRGAAALSLASLLCKILGVMYKIPLSRILLDEGMSYFNTAYTVYSFFFILCSALSTDFSVFPIFFAMLR